METCQTPISWWSSPSSVATRRAAPADHRRRLGVSTHTCPCLHCADTHQDVYVSIYFYMFLYVCICFYMFLYDSIGFYMLLCFYMFLYVSICF